MERKEYNHFFPPVWRHESAVIIFIVPEHNRCDIRKTRPSKAGLFSRDWSIHYLHKSSGTMLKMDRALAVGNAYENSMLDEIYLEAESITRPLSFFFSFAARGGTLVLPIIPPKSARNG